MSMPDLSAVAALYSESLKKHGTTPMGVGWRDESSQTLRFEKLAQVVDRSQPFTVNELGCGYGAFFEYLINCGAALQRFRGHEISDEMLRMARQRIGGSVLVQLSDKEKLDKSADYSFASGIFNVRLACNEDVWARYVKDTLVNMNENSHVGFSFNILSTYVDYREPHLYYGDPLLFFDFCKRNFSRFVCLSHDYPLYEWTITVKK